MTAEQVGSKRLMVNQSSQVAQSYQNGCHFTKNLQLPIVPNLKVERLQLFRTLLSTSRKFTCSNQDSGRIAKIFSIAALRFSNLGWKVKRAQLLLGKGLPDVRLAEPAAVNRRSTPYQNQTNHLLLNLKIFYGTISPNLLDLQNPISKKTVFTDVSLGSKHYVLHFFLGKYGLASSFYKQVAIVVHWQVTQGAKQHHIASFRDMLTKLTFPVALTTRTYLLLILVELHLSAAGMISSSAEVAVVQASILCGLFLTIETFAFMKINGVFQRRPLDSFQGFFHKQIQTHATLRNLSRQKQTRYFYMMLFMLDFLAYYLQMEKSQIEHQRSSKRSSLTSKITTFKPLEIVSLIDKSLLQSIENIYRVKEDGLDPLEFTRFFMNCIEHEESQSASLAAGLSQLFQIISSGGKKVKFSQLTDFICQEIIENQGPIKQLQAKWIPIRGHQQIHSSYLRQPPLITGRTDQLYKVWLDRDLLDNGKHQDAISHACYSQTRNRIYCLQSLADWIGIYSSQAKLEKKVKPASFRAKKDSAVVSIGFSQKQERLGAILKDFSISFWDASDNYSFQKSINTTKYCQQFQNQIWYLEFFQKWVTADLEGKLYLWNLIEERPQKIIKSEHKLKITDICQIPSISLLAVAQEQKANHTQSAKIQLLSLSKAVVVAKIDTRFQRRMLHTIRYSEEYQVLLSAGYQKKIKIFEINKEFLDSSLRGQLLGHESAVTCFNLIRKTPMIVSADDRGKVKVWNIKNFKCMQTLDFTEKVSITRVIDMGMQKKIALMGSRIIMLNLETQPQDIQAVVPVKVKSLPNSLLVFTPQDMRTIDLKTGKLLSIDFQFSRAISQVTSILISKKQMITGNDKGQVSFYCKVTGKLKQVQQWHSGPVQYLQQDTINGLVLSYSTKSGFIVVGRGRLKWQEVRQLKYNFTGKELQSIFLAARHSLFGFISQRSVYVSDYQQFRILHKFTFTNQNPTYLTFINGLSLLLIGTSLGVIHIYELYKESARYCLHIQCHETSITNLITDIQCHQENSITKLDSCYVYCSFESGKMEAIDLTPFAQAITFKENKTKDLYCNPHRQVRQSFQLQLKKFSKLQYVDKLNSPSFAGSKFSLNGHAGSITSLAVAQNEEHFVISSGNDHRIKIWRHGQLIGDLNINLPLPYLWNVRCSENKAQSTRVMQGLEVIQMMFKRFGKDISIGESRLFKGFPNLEEHQAASFLTSIPTKNRLKRKPTLFQEEFTPVDLHFQKIRKDNLMEVGGPSLRRMEVSKKISNLQKNWQASKEREQTERKALISNIYNKAQRNEEKDSILTILKDRKNVQIEQPKEQSLITKTLELKLKSSIGEKSIENSSYSNLNSIIKPGKEPPYKHIERGKHPHKRSNSKRTLQAYFNQKYSSCGRLTAQSPSIRSNECSRRYNINSVQADTIASEIAYKKNNNFRIMLREIREKLSKSKNRNSETYSVVEDFSMTARNFMRHKSANTSQLLNELGQQNTTMKQEKA